MEKTIELKRGTITYILTYKKVKNINLRVKPDGKAYISAPKWISERYIDLFVLNHSDFILDAVESYKVMKKYLPKKIEYNEGEKVTIFNYEYTIRLIESKKSFSKIVGNEIIISLPDTDNMEKKEKLFEEFLKSWAIDIFTVETIRNFDAFKKLGVEFPEIKVKKMKSRWGSCTPAKKSITLNLMLMFTNDECIRYVIIHELSHFIYPNHSKKFYALVEKIMPEWRAADIYLDRIML